MIGEAGMARHSTGERFEVIALMTGAKEAAR